MSSLPEHQHPLFRSGETEAGTAVPESEFARDLRTGIETLEAEADKHKSPVNQRIDTRALKLAEELFSEIASTGGGVDGKELLDKLNYYEAVASGLESNQPNISPRAFNARRYPDESTRDLVQARYIDRGAARTAAGVKGANAGNPEAAGVREKQNRDAGDSRAVREEKVAISRVAKALERPINNLAYKLERDLSAPKAA